VYIRDHFLIAAQNAGKGAACPLVARCLEIYAPRWHKVQDAEDYKNRDDIIIF